MTGVSDDVFRAAIASHTVEVDQQETREGLWPYNDEDEEAMRAYWREVGAQIITARDMAKCPNRSMNPAHYHEEDGRCRCGERPEALEALAQVTELKLRVEGLYRAAKRWVNAC